MTAHAQIIAAPVPMVYAAISAVMSEIGAEGILKGRRSQGGASFNFRGIDDVYNAMSPILCKHRLMILPRMISSDHEERISAANKPVYWTYVTAEFDLVCADDGSLHTCRTFGEALDSSDKSTNKAMSAAFKYAAMQAFCIPTEGDNDADATTHEMGSARNADADFSPAQVVIAITKHLKASKNKAGLDMAWKDTRADRAKVKTADEGLHANLVGVFTKMAESFAPPIDEVLDDTNPFGKD